MKIIRIERREENKTTILCSLISNSWFLFYYFLLSFLSYIPAIFSNNLLSSSHVLVLLPCIKILYNIYQTKRNNKGQNILIIYIIFTLICPLHYFYSHFILFPSKLTHVYSFNYLHKYSLYFVPFQINTSHPTN